jgi:hypothetical protein
LRTRVVFHKCVLCTLPLQMSLGVDVVITDSLPQGSRRKLKPLSFKVVPVRDATSPNPGVKHRDLPARQTAPIVLGTGRTAGRTASAAAAEVAAVWGRALALTESEGGSSNPGTSQGWFCRWRLLLDAVPTVAHPCLGDAV